MKGSVIKRGSKWAVVVDQGRDAAGKRIRKWHSGYPTKKAAEQARIEILSSMQNGVYVAPSKVTVAAWLAQWLEGRTNLAETSRGGYEADVKRISKGLGQIHLRDLSTSQISAYWRDLGGSYAAKTIRNTQGTLHKALADAVVHGVLARNPADHVELPRSDSPEMETWNASELATFLSVAERHRLSAAWRLMCSTGMRRSEVLGLRWRNIDMDAGRLAVVDTVVPVRNKPVLRVGETKSRRSRRVVALDSRTVAVLREHRKLQNEERLRAGEAWENLDLAFTDEIGRIYDPNRFTRQTKELAVKAGVSPLTPHAARHTWATLALASGVHPKVVQERLGHSSIAITLDRYSHVIDGMDREAAETVAALIR
ncbi:tyrosine-type recombinase/integrase [soil metagenome]